VLLLQAHEPAGTCGPVRPRRRASVFSDVRPASPPPAVPPRALSAARIRPYLKNLPVLADSANEGAGAGVHVR